MRGEVYTIEEKTFFCMGGARSIDKQWRKFGVSWWPEEMPSREEYDNALSNLAAHGFRVDYVITHDAPTKILEMMYRNTWSDPLTDFLDCLEYEHKLQFSHWYFGHHHMDREIDEKHTAIYKNIIQIIE